MNLPKLVVTTDAYQWIVNTEHVYGEKSKNAGETYLKPIAYCVSLLDAKRFAADYLLRATVPAEGIPFSEIETKMDWLIKNMQLEVQNESA